MSDHHSATGSSSGYGAEKSPFRPPPRRPLIQRVLPVAEHVRSYRGRILGRDALSGVTVAALALPAAMAYAELAGLPPVVGLYTLLLPAVAYAVLGSSRQVIVGPEGAIAAMVGAAAPRSMLMLISGLSSLESRMSAGDSGSAGPTSMRGRRIRRRSGTCRG